MDHDSRTERWERRTEIPLGVASLLHLTPYAVHVLALGGSGAGRVLWPAVLLAAWAVFALDYAVRRRLNGVGARFVRTHWLDTLVLLLHLRGSPRLAMHARVIVYAGLSVALLGFTGALAVYQQEHSEPGATIRTFGDVVWWTCATLATVGYGDVSPVTPVGRLVAVGLMACGLALLGAVTGSFSSWLLQVFSREEEPAPDGPEDG
ncbi:potassium channel family protein [Streptomyces sp. NBC_01390]|uniref:potassium channel family protein n=1 Tax=Streptomyces sp. NBC_01390 TaxID=2903850 RepID=UPI003250B438